MESQQGYTTINNILEQYYEEAEESVLSRAALIRQIGSVLSLITPHELLDNQTFEIPIKNHKGKLHCEIIELYQIRDHDKRIIYSASDIFHKTDHSEGFSLNMNDIFVDFKKGSVEINADILPVDKYGMPLIPANESYVLAVVNHLLWANAKKLYVQKKLTGDVLNFYAQERSWYIAQAETRGKIPSLSQMEKLKNSYTRILDNNGFENSFK